MKRIFMLLIFISGVTFAQYNTPGSGVTWTMDELVTNSGGTVTGTAPNYVINELVTVAVNDLINIAPGTIISFTTTNAGFEVDGALKAVGTESNIITFSSPNPDSTGSYKGLRFNDTSIDDDCIFEYVKVEYADYGFRAIGSSPSLSNSELYKCKRGVNLSSSDATITNNTITYCNEYGIILTLSSSPTIENNTLAYNNTQARSAKNQISVGLQGTNNPIIKGNTVHSGSGTKTGGISIWVSGNTNNSFAVIENNTIYNNNFGIALFSTNDGNINVTVKGNTIYNNKTNPDPMTGGSGININGSPFNRPVITENIIHDNFWGITIQNSSTVQAGPQPNIGNVFNASIEDDGKNKIYNNVQGANTFDLYNNCSNEIFAHNNDWGVYDSTSIEDHIFHNADNSAHGVVHFLPFWNGVVPVELASFTAACVNDLVELKWKTVTETNNLGFDIEKKSTGSWSKIGHVTGAGNSTEINSYSFTDRAKTGLVKYRLKQIDFDGTFSYSPEVEIELKNTIDNYSLDQNFPNPFNPSTKIKYQIAEAGNVNLTVYDALGSEVAVLVNSNQDAGKYEVNFDATNLSTGIYFYKIKTNSFTEIKKMMMIK